MKFLRVHISGRFYCDSRSRVLSALQASLDSVLATNGRDSPPLPVYRGESRDQRGAAASPGPLSWGVAAHAYSGAPVRHPVEGSWGGCPDPGPPMGCNTNSDADSLLPYPGGAACQPQGREGRFPGFIRAQMKAGCFPKSVPSGCSPLSPSRLPDSHVGSRGERSFPCCVRVVCLGASQMMEIKYLPFGAKSPGSKVGVMSGAGLSCKQLLPSCGRGDGHGP